MNVQKLCIAMLAVLALSACGGVDPNSPLGQRKAIFKEMLKTSEDMNGMLNGRVSFDGQRFSDAAVKLDALAQEPWKHFPQTKEADHTSAKDDVWQKQARFQVLVSSLETATSELKGVAAAKPPAAVLALSLSKVQAACEACHKEFRAY